MSNPPSDSDETNLIAAVARARCETRCFQSQILGVVPCVGPCSASLFQLETRGDLGEVEAVLRAIEIVGWKVVPT